MEGLPNPGLPDKSFLISRVELVGNTVISDADLTDRMAIIGRTVSVVGLLEAAAAATELYHERGYNVAQVVIPPQDLSAGSVTFIVLEGRLDADGLEIVDLSDGTINVERMTAILLNGVNQSEVIERAPYERALRLVDTMPGVRVRGWLYPGQSVGSARLRAELHPRPLAEGELAIDNYGSHATGAERFTLGTRIANPGRTHISLDLLASYTDPGNHYVSGHLSMPVGTNGLVLGGGADRLEYRIVHDPAFRGNNGVADHYVADLRYPFVLNARTALYGELSYNRIDQTARIQDILISEERVDFARAALEWTRSSITATGRTTGVLSVSYGEAEHRFGPDIFEVGGDFTLWRLDLAHLQTWSPRFYSLHALGAQTSDHNLNGYLRCHVGGPVSNRAYPLGEGSGDRCISLDNEFVFGVGPAGTEHVLQLVLLADAAQLKELSRAIPLFDNDTFNLASVGVGARWFWRDRFELRAEWAQQLIESPTRRRIGADTDGETNTSRFWIQAVLRF